MLINLQFSNIIYSLYIIIKSFQFLQSFPQTLSQKMRKGLASRTALKFQRYQIQKTQQNMSATFTTFRTHTLSKSDAQIMLPKTYNISNKNEDLIFLVTCGKTSFYAEISQNTFADKSLTEISILSNLVNIAGVALDSSGTFKGEMKCLDKQKIPKSYQLQYAQILVKNMYISRRDQYKVLKSLGDKIVHVYNRKTLYFDKLKLQVTNLMKNNQQICKTGIITKNTKIIFRSGCAKYTILVQISKEMFQLNQDKQLYLEKTIHFLLVFFQRNNFFNNKHRIEIILFARLFYPQFKTLREAYECLLKDDYNMKGNIFTINYAVALQKNCRGKIYQDVYRRLLWPSGSITGFRERFWERVSQFMFTINWSSSKSYAKYINTSVEQNIQREKLIKQNGKNTFKMKPFLHRLPCQLSDSKQTCFFEAISMISEQYKHHFYFRSLSETGNAITVVSAGKSIYSVEQTTYKMAKSNIYLTNINCIHINLKRRQPKIQVQILEMEKKPRYRKDDIKKLQNLMDWCLEEDAYKSPTIMNIEFADDFQLKSVIFPQNLKLFNQDDKKWSQFFHYCPKKVHYVNQEGNQKFINVRIIKKQIQWVCAYYMNEKSLLVHNFFYDNASSSFETDFIKIKKNKAQDTEFATFDRDLKIIINKKSNYSFSNMIHESLIAKRVNSYIVSATRFQQTKDSKQYDVNAANDQYGIYQMKYINKFFEISSLQDQQDKINKFKQKKLMSNSSTPDKQGSNPYLFSSTEIRKNERKASDVGQIQTEISIQKNKNYRKALGTVNIFEQTYKKRQYTPKVNLYRRNAKKNTHNKQRLKKNYRQSNMHYMMTYFNEPSNNYLMQFIRRPQPRTQDQKTIYQNFQLQREWKNIIFPILTPIYTNYRADLHSQQMNSKYSQFGQAVVEEEICKHLMQNFQIQKQNINSQITMSKGHVHLLLSITAKDNITLFQAINVDKQKRIVPKMLYRYLCYEEKDYRFGAKSLIFSDENYYTKQQKQQQKKSVKLVMLQQSCKGDGSNFKDFLKLLKQKYKTLKFDVNYQHNLKQHPSQTYTITIDLVEDLKNKIYKSQKIYVSFDKTYNPSCLYQIIVQWHYCCATYVNQFIENVISSARKNKIITYLVSKNNAFNTRWTTATIGEIVFQSRLAMELLEDSINRKRDWLWDREKYYMDRNGEAFIRFNKQKYLIEWYDNTIDKTKWKRLQVENRFYENFFMRSAAYDFLGGIIDSFTNNNSRKSSLALST